MDWKRRIKKDLRKLSSSKGDSIPVYKAICVEEHDLLREKLEYRLPYIGNSRRDMKIEFSILKYNSEIPIEIVRSGGTDLVIVDLDQNGFDPIDITSQIRAFGAYTPIFFASVELIKAQKILDYISKNDLRYFSGESSLLGSGPFSLNLTKLDLYLLQMQAKGKTVYLNEFLFPILNNLIYHAVDKARLYLAGGPRLIPSAIIRAKEIKRHVDKILHCPETRKNNNDKGQKDQ